MFFPSRLPFVSLLAGALLMGYAFHPAAVDAAKKKGGKGRKGGVKISSQGLKEDVARAQAGLAHANQRGVAAQSRLGASQARAMAAYNAVEAAKAEAEEAGQRLRQIEAQLTTSQGPDSDYAAALKDLREAEKWQAEVRARVYNSAEYQAKYREAMRSPNKATLLPKIRREAEKADPEFAQSAVRLQVMKTRYEQARTALFQNDPEYVAASKTAMEAKKRQAEAQKHFKAAMVSKGITSANLSKAARDSAAAQAAIAKGQAAIKAVEAHNKKVEQQRRNSQHYRRRR
jgi:hypothetical protein